MPFFCKLYLFQILLQIPSGSLSKFHDHIYNNVIIDIILVRTYVRFSWLHHPFTCSLILKADRTETFSLSFKKRNSILTNIPMPYWAPVLTNVFPTQKDIHWKEGTIKKKGSISSNMMSSNKLFLHSNLLATN